jgi:hypothetical protein
MFLNSKTKYQQMFQLLKPRPNPKHKKNKLKMLPLKPLKASLTLLSNLLMNNLSPMLKLNLLPKTKYQAEPEAAEPEGEAKPAEEN